MDERGLDGADGEMVAALERVADACERYESEWRAGQTPQIERFIHGLRGPRFDELLRHLIAVDVQLRSGRGERPLLREYLERFPGNAAVVSEAFRAPAIDREATQSTERDTPSVTTPLSTSDVPTPRLASDSTTAGMVAGGRSVALEFALSSSENAPEALPERLGRYTPSRLLGQGGFGRVYLARDEELSRAVAIKVPLPRAFESPSHVENFVSEARMAARLRHPGIVAVYDIGSDAGGRPFVVFEYIEGRTLGNLFESGRPPLKLLAEVLAWVADAAHHAHQAGLVHRDLKPSNILIDANGLPHITDFGLALPESLARERAGEIAGTHQYMAPEQVRGESHRLDGRTDVWALGVILYRGLRGRLPFTGRDREEIFDEILHRDPKPPRQDQEPVPRELERICLKCLAKRMADRYQTAADLADDLRSWATGATTAPATSITASSDLGITAHRAPVVPKGLRCFEREDADFFLRLLPGPRDREGMPQSIRSWKTRIESGEAGGGFPVGVIYGPSGCGKSSLIKAGLLPKLAREIRVVLIESAPEATESRLLAALRRELPGLPASLTLSEAAAAIRAGDVRGLSGKVLIVLDQFEQWLHHHPEIDDCELIRALRQCDGRGLQALLLVRDDFWMAITRFLRALEVRMVEGQNSAAVELFDLSHARRVLMEFGRARGRLPDDAPVSAETDQFLNRALSELADRDGQIIPVRLSLFAEMLRNRPWTPATLRELGGMEGIGVTFLEETFAGRSAPPTYRVHARAAQAVLRSLLPDPSSDLKGNLRSGRALQESAGYADRPDDFRELMSILDTELRMVTPADPEGSMSGSPAAPGERSYQLTHDYLVPPLRQWLTRKQRETRRGRAEIRLEEITALWKARPERRRLPSLLEWLAIAWNTRSRTWTADERTLMQTATRHYALRAAGAVLIAMTLGFLGYQFRQQERAEALLGRTLKADFRHLPNLLVELEPDQARVRHTLLGLERSAPAASRDRELAEILLFRDQPTEARAAALRARIATAEADELAIIREALASHPVMAGVESIRRVVFDDLAAPAARLRAACVLAELGSAQPAEWSNVAPAFTNALLAEDRRTVPRWLDLLGPAAPSLIATLGGVCRELKQDSTTRSTAAEALTELLTRRHDSVTLARFVVESQPDASRILQAQLMQLGRQSEARAYLYGVLREPRDPPVSDERAQRHAAAAIALAALGEPEALWPLLRHHDDPSVRSTLIERLPAADFLRPALAESLERPGIDPVERQAVLLAWAESKPSALTPTIRTAVVEGASHLYVTDPTSGVHSAAELLLRRWGEQARLAQSDARLKEQENPPSDRRWKIGPNGHTFAVVTGPLEFQMGSPEKEQRREAVKEQPQWRRIERTLAVSTKEVTFAQFHKFQQDRKQDPRFAPVPECPMNEVNWHQAVAYCNWLTKSDPALTADDCCYNERLVAGLILHPDALKRRGYRLPTEAEWEYLCRGGCVTSRSFGESEALMPAFAWTWLNSGDQLHPVGMLLPNEYGLFDLLGNSFEWCHDGQHKNKHGAYPPYPEGTKEHPSGDPDGPRRTVDNDTWRIMRGGAFCYAPAMARSASRYATFTTLTHPYTGFRVVRTIASTEK
jgi:serine/threonine protein kinase/formylglycine-generating enzyme required for sulfatase activity